MFDAATKPKPKIVQPCPLLKALRELKKTGFSIALSIQRETDMKSSVETHIIAIDLAKVGLSLR